MNLKKRCPCDVDGSLSVEECKADHACDACLKFQEENSVKSKLFVAVIVSKSAINGSRVPHESLKGQGEWNAHLGATRDEAIDRAVQDRDRYDKLGSFYRILVGELTNEAQLPITKYEVVDL